MEWRLVSLRRHFSFSEPGRTRTFSRTAVAFRAEVFWEVLRAPKAAPCSSIAAPRSGVVESEPCRIKYFIVVILHGPSEVDAVDRMDAGWSRGTT